MQVCCPDWLRRLEDAAAEPPRPQRWPAAEMGALCGVCGRRAGLEGYPWHVAGCGRLWRAREAAAEHPEDARWHWAVAFTALAGVEPEDQPSSEPPPFEAALGASELPLEGKRLQEAAAVLVSLAGRKAWVALVARALSDAKTSPK